MTSVVEETRSEDRGIHVRWLLFDVSEDVANGGQTYFTTDEDEYCWTADRRRAHRFNSSEDAHAQLEECDPDCILRDRLFVVPDGVWAK